MRLRDVDEKHMDPTTSTTEPKPEPRLAGNRRRGIRHVLHIPATMQVDAPDAAPINVTVIALSVGGIGIAAKSSVRINAVYRISAFDTLLPPGLRIRVVSERKLGENNFEIGAEVL